MPIFEIETPSLRPESLSVPLYEIWKWIPLIGTCLVSQTLARTSFLVRLLVKQSLLQVTMHEQNGIW